MKKVSTITPISPEDSDNSSHISISLEEVTKRELQSEKDYHTQAEAQRWDEFTNIIRNTTSRYKSWTYFKLGVFKVLAALIVTFLSILIPVHNVIRNPQYWYEFLIQIILFFNPPLAAASVIGFLW